MPDKFVLLEDSDDLREPDKEFVFLLLPTVLKLAGPSRLMDEEWLFLDGAENW